MRDQIDSAACELRVRAPGSIRTQPEHVSGAPASRTNFRQLPWARRSRPHPSCSCLNHARLLMAVRVGGGAAGRSRSASAQRAPADCSNASPSLRVRDEPSQFARSSFIPGDGQPAARDALPTSGVLRAAEGHAARRGGLGARRWADIRQAARLACDTGVMVKLHDVEIHPLLTEDGQAFLSYDKENGVQCNRHDAGRGQKPSNTMARPRHVSCSGSSAVRGAFSSSRR